MIRAQKRMRWCITALICNIMFIWGNSLLPGQLSGAFSQWVGDALKALFPFLSVGSGGGHGVLRKLAHFTEYTTLGMCLLWLFSMLKKSWWISVIAGFSVACVDETIQCFVPDRGPAIKDVCIDTAGVVLGTVLVLAGIAICQYKIKKQSTEEFEQ